MPRSAAKREVMGTEGLSRDHSSGAVMGQGGLKVPGEAGRACWCSPWGPCCESEFHVMSMLWEVVTGSGSEESGAYVTDTFNCGPFGITPQL